MDTLSSTNLKSDESSVSAVKDVTADASASTPPEAPLAMPVQNFYRFDARSQTKITSSTFAISFSAKTAIDINMYGL